MADNSNIVDLESKQALVGKSIKFHALQQNQIERNNVSLLAQSNPLLQSSQFQTNQSLTLTPTSNWLSPISSAATSPGYCKEDQGIDKDLLIELVRAYPSIWDIRSPLYKDQQRKNLAWREIYIKMAKKYESECRDKICLSLYLLILLQELHF